VPGRLELFPNTDEYGNPFAKPNTLLIDSEQLESGEALDDKFRAMAADEIDRFRREIIERTGDRQQAENITDQDLLREVMNTVGKEGRLGEQIRCVVSVSMLTEGWDANTVTHVLGVRAFGTQLLCEQVIGRALRRQSYELIEEGEDKGCTGKNDGQCYFCPWSFYRWFSCRQLRSRIRRPRRSVTLLREQRFFNTTAPRVMELMDEGMDQHQLP
jgi:hypothetical protein